MVNRANAEYAEERPGERRRRSLGRSAAGSSSPCASLVQAEGKSRDDFGKIAPGRLQPAQARQHRDLRLLEFDSTYNYAKGQSKLDTEHRRDRKYNIPYNTYKHQGPAARPHRQPRADAPRAALAPTHGGWYYFVIASRQDPQFTEDARRAPEQLVDKIQRLQRKRADDATPHGQPCSARPSPTRCPRCCTGRRYRALGLDGWSYDRFEIDEAALPGFLARLGPEWAGLSLTMPLKRAVIPLLDEITPPRPPSRPSTPWSCGPTGARSVTTPTSPDMVAALHERGVEKTESAAILGAGATASSALAALARICTGEVTVYVRSERRADEMRQWGERLGVQVRPADWSDAARAFEAPLVISTTPAGGTDALAAELPAHIGTLFDVLYDPWPTPLAAAWEARGGHVARRPRPAGPPGGPPVRASSPATRVPRWPRCARPPPCGTDRSAPCCPSAGLGSERPAGRGRIEGGGPGPRTWSSRRRTRGRAYAGEYQGASTEEHR